MSHPAPEPCLYFVRAWRNQRVTEWTPMPDPFQDHRIRTRKLQQITQGMPLVEIAPSFWVNNGPFQASLMGANMQPPSESYCILKLPVRLVRQLTEPQALKVVQSIDPQIIRNLIWSSTDRHCLSTIHHLPGDEAGARIFYRSHGDALFRDMQRWAVNNAPHTTIGHKHGPSKPQMPQPNAAASAPVQPPARRITSSPPPQPATSPMTPHRPTRNFNLHKRFGLKGTHPSPDALKQLKKIWAGQSDKPADPAADSAPQPKPDMPPKND